MDPSVPTKYMENGIPLAAHKNIIKGGRPSQFLTRWFLIIWGTSCMHHNIVPAVPNTFSAIALCICSCYVNSDCEFLFHFLCLLKNWFLFYILHLISFFFPYAHFPHTRLLAHNISYFGRDS